MRNHTKSLYALLAVCVTAMLFGLYAQANHNDRVYEQINACSVEVIQDDNDDDYIYNVAYYDGNGTLTDEDGHVFRLGDNNIIDKFAALKGVQSEGVYWVGYDHNGTAGRLDDIPVTFTSLEG